MTVMEGIELRAKTPDGRTMTLPAPAQLLLDRTEDTPADRLTAAFEGDAGIREELAEMTLRAAGGTVFSGLVDTQQIRTDGAGIRLQLDGRSDAAVLLDNEALPQTYYRLTLGDLCRLLLAPYGFGGPVLDLPDRWLASFVIPKGTSVWEAVERFCLQAGLPPPRIDTGRQLVVRQGLGTVRRIANREAGALRWLSAERAIHRSEILSEIRVRAEDGVYRAVCPNPHIAGRGIVRTRLLIPPSAWAQGGILDAADRIRQSMRASSDCTVLLEGWAAVDPGDRVEMPELGETPPDGWYAAGVRHRVEADGITTELVLREVRYRGRQTAG